MIQWGAHVHGLPSLPKVFFRPPGKHRQSVRPGPKRINPKHQPVRPREVLSQQPTVEARQIDFLRRRSLDSIWCHEEPWACQITFIRVESCWEDMPLPNIYWCTIVGSFAAVPLTTFWSLEKSKKRPRTMVFPEACSIANSRETYGLSW